MRIAARTRVPTVIAALVTLVLALVVPGFAAAPAHAAGVAYTWTGLGNDNLWTDALNWSPSGVPGTGDSAAVSAPSDDLCNAHVHGVPTGLSLVDLTVDERAYRGDPDSPCLTSLDDGSITVTHAFVFHAGTVDTAVTVAAGATGSITPGFAHASTALGTGGLTVDGAVTLAGNTGSASLSLTGGPGITVDAGGTLTAQGGNQLHANCCSSPAHLLNRGTVQLTGDLLLDAVELDQNATLNAVGGARLTTDFAPQTAGKNARWTGNGSWLMSYAGDVTATGKQTLAAGFTWILGGNGSTSDEELFGTPSLTGTGRFEWDGGTIGAALTLGHGITTTMSGPDGADPRYLDGRNADKPVAVTNHGAMTVGGDAGYYAVSSGRLVNASDGTLTLTPGASLGADCCASVSAAVVNSGRVVVPAGSGSATTVSLDNVGYQATGGSASLAAGTVLALTGGAPGLLSSTTITGGGTLNVAASVTASGTDTVDSGTTVLLGDHGRVESTGSAGTTVSGGGTFRWFGGELAGQLTLATAGGQDIGGTATKTLALTSRSTPSALTLAGPTTVEAGTPAQPDLLVDTDRASALALTGATTVGADVEWSGVPITNSGSLTVAAGTSRFTLDQDATLTTSGTLTVASGTLVAGDGVVQTAGTTSIAPGATLQTGTSTSTSLRVNGGTLAGGGQVKGSVAVTGATLSPGAGTGQIGTLSVTGALTVGATSTVVLDLAASSRDQVLVRGSAKLGGTLRLVDAPGYQPATGDVVTVLTAKSVTANFGCVSTAGPGSATQYWTVAVAGRTALQLTSRPGTASTC